jgi:hypothetical protein
MKRLILLLMLVGLAAAAGDPLLGQSPTSPSDEILNQLDIIAQIIVPLMMVMVVMAASALVIGQMLGAEYRAKATQWAHGMLAAVGVSALVLIMLYTIVPAYMTGGVPFEDIITIIGRLRDIAEFALVGLIALLVLVSAGVYAMGQVMGAQSRAKATVWATGLLVGAIVAAVIYVVMFQILTQVGTTFFAGTPLAIYSGVIIQVAFFVTFIILITYMLSKVFKVPEWEAYLGVELSNLLSSFVIVVFVIGMFGVGSVVSAVYGGDPSPPKAAIIFMKGMVLDRVLTGLYDVYQIQACTSILSTISRRIGEFVLTQTYKVFPGMDTFVQISNVIAFGLVSIYGSISAQVAFLYLVDSLAVNFILPAGLILRFFPPTRDAGAFLIALAFGFQIIFPTTYLINKQIFEDIEAVPYDTPTALIASICGPFKYGVYGVLFNTAVNPVFSWVPGGTIVGTFLARLFSESLLNYITMDEFLVVMEHISTLSLLALFMPALSMLVTIAFINAMTKFIVAKV